MARFYKSGYLEIMYVIFITHITTCSKFIKTFDDYDLAKKWMLYKIVILVAKELSVEPMEIVKLFQNSSIDEIISVFSSETLMISYRYI